MSRARSTVALVVVPLLLVASPARAEDAKELVLDYGGAQHVFVRIPKGKLTQGSPVNEAGREVDEASRPVTLSRDLWMGAHLVSRGEFAAFVEDARYLTEAERGQSGGFGWDGKVLVQKKEYTWRSPGFAQTDEHPVVLVTWGDANAYAAWVSRKTGRRVRLPTEAEWEHAARAGTTTPWYAGATEQDALASGWFKPNAGSGTHARAEKRANPFGLFDMAGNVYEWCRDVYAPYPKGPAIDPEQTSGVPGEPERRVLRGGSWMREPKKGRSAARYRATPGTRNAENGFRLVVSDEESLTPGMLGGKPDFAPAAPIALGGPDAGAAPIAAGKDGAASTSDASLWPLLLAPAAAAGAVAAWLLARRRGGGAKGFATRPGDDGFWVRAPAESRGARIRYDCVVNGTVVTDVVPLDGGEETFVYTGGRPSAIRILEVVTTQGGYRQPDARGGAGSVAPGATPGIVPGAPAASAVVPARRASSTQPALSSWRDEDNVVRPVVVNQIVTSSSSASDEPFLGTPRAY